MSTENSSKKLILAAVLGAVAITLFFVLNRDDSMEGEAAGEKSLWYCTACQKSFELNARQAQTDVRPELRESAGEGADNSEPQARGRGDRVMFNIAKCPSCNEWKGEAARKCQDCGEIFVARTSKGQTSICPKCKWDPSTGQKAEGDRLDALP